MAKITFIEVTQGKDTNHQRRLDNLRKFQIHSHAAAATHRQSSRAKLHALKRSNTEDLVHRRPELNRIKSANEVNDPTRALNDREGHHDKNGTEGEPGPPLDPVQQSARALGRSHSPYSKIRQQHSDFTLQAVDYFVSALTPVQVVVDGIFAVNTVYTQTLLQLMLCAEEYGHGGAASVNASVHRTEGPKHIPRYVILETCKAISDHRNHLEKLRGQSDDLAIITNLILTSIAEGMEDLQSIIIFRHHLKSLITAAGGFHGPRLSQLIRNAILQWESCSALVLGTPTAFADKYPLHVPYYPSEPFSSEVKRMVSILPTGLQQLAGQGRLAYHVLKILERVTNSEGVQQQNSPSQGIDPFTTDKDRFTSYWQACPCLSYPDDAAGKPHFEKLLVLGVIMYLYHSITPHRVTSMLYRAARKRLTADVSRRVPMPEEEKDALLWVWLNAIDACQQPGARLTVQAEKLLTDARGAFPNVETREDLEDRLMRLFHNEAFMVRCLQFWRRATER